MKPWATTIGVRRLSALVLVVYVLMLAGCRSHCHRPVLSEVGFEGAVSATAETAPAVLKILTWNIWMMPPWTFQSPRNDRRAEAVAAELLALDYDILCLEKVFDSGARRVLETAMAERYPFQYGPANCGGGPKLNSGVWVLSRIPLTDYREIRYRDCSGVVDCFARKGAISLKGEVGGHAFQLVATHLQGGSGPKSSPKNQAVRALQLTQLRDELVAPVAAPGVPLFLCGDFVTPRYDETESTQADSGLTPSESEGYQFLLGTFDAQNGPEYRITLDERRAYNDLAKPRGTRTGELDYIFVNPRGTNLRLNWERHLLRREGWDDRKKRRDLSYRYAVGLRVEFP